MKIIFTFIAVLAILSSAFATDQPSNGGVAKPSNGVKIPGVVVKNIEYNNKLDLYEVATADGQLFYLTKDTKHVVFGNAFEIATMKNVTEERKSHLFKVDFSKLPLDKAVKITDGQKKIAVFSSPDCPWCRKLHPEIKKLSGVSAYVFLVSYGSPEKLKSIWCSSDRAEALEKAYSGTTLPPNGNSCNYQPVIDSGNLAKSLSVNAYPTIITDDGRRISGYLAFDKLRDAIYGTKGGKN